VQSGTKPRSKAGPERAEAKWIEPRWCNDVWAVDFKGWFRTGGMVRNAIR